MKPKIKHSTLCNNYQDGGLKNVSIESKIISLQCSWIKRLFDKNMHNWKIIPLTLIEKFLGKDFKFHSNVKIENKYIRNFPKYYQEMINAWSKNFSSLANLPSAILSQYLWFNSKILVDNKSFKFACFSDNNINFVKNVFTSSGKLKKWGNFKEEFNLQEKHKFKWLQLTHAIPVQWKSCLLQDKGNSFNLAILDHHLIKKNKFLLWKNFTVRSYILCR